MIEQESKYGKTCNPVRQLADQSLLQNIGIKLAKICQLQMLKQVQHDMCSFRKSLIFSFGVVMLLIVLNLPAFAQNGGAAGSFSRMGFGPRGMAMGNALVSVIEEGIYSYYNPALAAQAAEGNQVDFSTAAMSFDRNFNTASSTFRLPPTAGVTLSLMNASVNNIDGRSANGYHTGTLNTQEYQAAAAMGIQITDEFSAGLGLKYFIADYHTDLSIAKTLGLDLGLLYHFSDRFRGGASVQDLLASYNWNSGLLYGDESSARTDDFPTQYRIGASYNITSTLLLSIEGGRTSYKNTASNNMRIGSSYHLHERITLRGGWKIDEFSSPKKNSHGSGGFSIHLPFDLLSPSVDYAFIQEQNNISYMHIFGLRLNL